MKGIKKVFSVLLVAVMMLSAFAIGIIPANALTPTYTVSSSYASSTYYSKLCAVNLTGNQRDDILAVAWSQYGYHEGSSSSYLSGSSSGSGNYTEYGYWYGTQVLKKSSGYYDQWCAMFVSWCARQAGITTSVLQNSVAAGHTSSFFNIKYYAGGTQGAHWSDTDHTYGDWGGNNYIPKPGDLFFKSDWSHVGLVSSVNGTKFTSIEGNSSNKVSSNPYNIADYYFGVPDYEETPPTPIPARPSGVWTDYPVFPAGSTVPVSWTAAEGATSYHVEGWAKFPNGEDYCFINEDVGFVLSYEMGLSDAATYTIFVYAVNSSGRSEANSCTFTVRAISSTPDWFRTCTLDGHTYSVYLASMTWHEAQEWCQNHGGHLATITDTNEWKAVTFLTERIGEPHFFLGGTKESGAWQWVTNEAFSYTCWGEGQPDWDYETQLSLWNHNGEWNNVKFNEPLVYGFIYEQDPSAFSTQETDVKPTITTTAYILNEGQVTVPDDSRIGTAPSDTISANRISGLKFSLLNCSGSINYRAHVSNIGWQSWVKDGARAGVSDYSEGIEAVEISLSGDVATKYSVYYHTFVFGKGWNPWAKDGETSGTIGGGFPITAIRVMLVPKATYCVHISGQGWTVNSMQGNTAGTTGQELGLEAIAIDLCDHAYGDVKYKTHMAKIGWGHSRYNGVYSGTTGLTLQSEAFKAELLGTAASKYDILYRAHVAEIGWLDWQRNGNIAGTTGEDRQMEAIQVMVVPKNYQITDTLTYETYEESIKRTIYFNANGGTCSTQSKTVIFGSTYGTLPTPTREGMTFIGWFTDTNVPVTPTTMCGLSGNMTVYAHWEYKSYAVKFNGNGATSGSMSNQTFTYDVAQNLTANAFQRKYTVTYNYDGATGGNSAASATATATFNGWATSASGAKVYNDKQSVINLATSGTVNLYANWTLGSVTLPTPTKTGYTFGGWYTDSALTTSAGAAGVSYTPSADVPLYAHWTANAYTVTLDPDGGACGISAVTAYYDEVYGVLPVPTRSGFTFDGWFTSDGAQVTESTVVTTADDHTLCARWTAVEMPAAITPKAGSTAVVDTAHGFIYGLDFELTEAALREQYLDAANGSHFVIEGSGAIGTGTVMRIVDNETGNEIDTFTIIIFGDLTGDGLLNSSDITTLRSISASLIEYDDDSPFLFAADVTHDGLVNSTDITQMRSAAASLTDIVQQV